MDATDLFTLAAGLGGTFTGFFVGLRVCGPRINTCWTERHPRALAEDIRAGRLTMDALGEDTRRLVLAEMARAANGLTLDQSAQFLALNGVNDRFVRSGEPRWAHTREEW
ncbi:MAG TPA: hypothetical protein VHF26_14100 [Trebonia sp.]|nr:hypothetical protein [Trebonia sp.]